MRGDPPSERTVVAPSRTTIPATATTDARHAAGSRPFPATIVVTRRALHQQPGDEGRHRDRGDDAEAADQGADDLGRDRLVVEDRAGRLVADEEDDEQRQPTLTYARNRVLTVAPMCERPIRIALTTSAGPLRSPFSDSSSTRTACVTVTSSRTPTAPEDDRRQEDTAEVETRSTGHRQECQVGAGRVGEPEEGRGRRGQ